MLERIARLFRLTPEEIRHALLLGAILFTLSTSYTLVKTARDALFLARFPAQLLPWVFLGVGALTTVAAAAFTRLTRSRRTSVALELGALASSVVMGASAFLSTLPLPWVPFALFLWVNAYGVILLSQFWSHTTSMSDPRVAKRTFGMIGAFGVLGGLAGGALAGPLAAIAGAPAILAAGAVVTAFAAPFVRLSSNRALRFEEPVSDEREGAGPPLHHGYVRWLALATLCSVLVSTVLDYRFKIAIQRRDPSPQAVAPFLRHLYVVANLLALPIQLFGSPWALQSLGASSSAAILPAGPRPGAGAILLGAGFPAVVGARLWDQVM